MTDQSEIKSRRGIVIFTKTPGFSSVMTRLGKSVDSEHIQSQLIKYLMSNLKNYKPLWAIAEKEALDAKLWEGQEILLQEGTSFEEKLLSVIKKCSSRFDEFLITSSDVPHINDEIILKSFESLENYDYCFTPAEDGGFVAVSMKSTSESKVFKSVEYSSSTTLQQIIDKTKNYQLLATSYDIDTLNDLKRFISENRLNVKDYLS